MKLRTILVPLDGSSAAEVALTPAVDLAREAGAKLVLLRAAEAQTLPMAGPIEAQVTVIGEVQEYLAAVRDRLMAAGVDNVEVSAWYGPAVEAIVEAARYRDADLIVMSSHGRSGVACLMLGHVTERVLGSTSVPILVIRADGRPVDTPFSGTSIAREVANV